MGGGHGRDGVGDFVRTLLRAVGLAAGSGGLAEPTSAATHLSGWTGPRLQAAPGWGRPGVVEAPGCVWGGACLVVGRQAARGSAQPPAGGGLPGAELGRLGLRALAGAAVWEQSVLQEFRPRPGAGALPCPHPPRPRPLPTSQASFQFGGVEVAIST